MFREIALEYSSPLLSEGVCIYLRYSLPFAFNVNNLQILNMDSVWLRHPAFPSSCVRVHKMTYDLETKSNFRA